MCENIFLIGFMGAGKSSVGREYASRYHRKLMEMDDEIAREEGQPIPKIFEEKGEPYFRALETELLKKLSGEKNLLVSCGGGVVLRSENVAWMKKNGVIVLLDASPETILERVSRKKNSRPVLKGKMNIPAITELMEERRPYYENAADVHIMTDGKSFEEICREIRENTGRIR